MSEAATSTSPESQRHQRSSNGIGSNGTDKADQREKSPDDEHAADSGEPVKKKQKRNKPTLSCSDCVERKTKVSLVRAPMIFSSIIGKIPLQS